jgi:hypothetical protein
MFYGHMYVASHNWCSLYGKVRKCIAQDWLSCNWDTVACFKEQKNASNFTQMGDYGFVLIDSGIPGDRDALYFF